MLVGAPDPRGESWRSSATGVGFYLAVCRLTRTFLNEVFRRGSGTTAALGSGQAPPGIPEWMIAMRFEAGER